MQSDLFEVPVKAEKNMFSVAYLDGIFSEEDEVTSNLVRSIAGNESPRIMLIADSNVVDKNPDLGSSIGKYINARGIELVGDPILIKGAKENKVEPFKLVSSIVNAMTQAKIAANDAVLIMGGGALIDAAGFAASIYNPKCQNTIRIPTTLTACIESAFADRVSLDSFSKKDAYTVEALPYASIVDPNLSKTIFDGVWKGGIGAAIRYASVSDPALMKKIMKETGALKSRDEAKTRDFVRGLVSSRAKNSGSDFGVWCANRLWSMSAGKIPYGYALSIGVCLDCAYAVATGILSPADQEKMCRAVALCGALDGLHHSLHIISQFDALLSGLDEWALATGSYSRTVPSGVGKSTIVESADKDLYKQILKDFISSYSSK